MKTRSYALLGLVLFSTLITSDFTDAQIMSNSPLMEPSMEMMGMNLNQTSNPLQYFEFEPDSILAFLWNSLRPEYQSTSSAVISMINTPGNITDIIIKMSYQTIGVVETEMLLQKATIRKLLEMIDRELLATLMKIDWQSGNFSGVMTHLDELNVMSLMQDLTTPLFSDIQTWVLPNNITTIMDSLMSKLENNQSITEDIKSIIMSMEGPMEMFMMSTVKSYMVDIFFAAPISVMDESLRVLTQAMKMMDPLWSQRSSLEKTAMLAMSYDYEELPEDVKMTGLQMAYGVLSSEQTTMLSTFLGNVENFDHQDLANLTLQVISMVYEQLREGAMMCNMTYMILPEGSIQDLDLSMLQMIGVFDEVQTGLWEAVLNIQRDSNLTAMWKSGSDLQRLTLLVMNFDTISVSDKVMGNVLRIMPAESSSDPLLYMLTDSILKSMNLSEGGLENFSDFCNKSLSLTTLAWRESYVSAPGRYENWTMYDNTEKLAAVMSGIDFEVMGMRLTAALITEMTTNWLPEDIQTMMSGMIVMLDSSDENSPALIALKQQIDTVWDMAHMMVWNMSFPEIMTGNRDVIVVELIGQLTDTYKELSSDSMPMLEQFLAISNLTYDNLPDAEKTFYLIISLNHTHMVDVTAEQIYVIVDEMSSLIITQLENCDTEGLFDVTTLVSYLEQQASMCNMTAELVQYLDMLNNCSVTAAIMDDMKIQLAKMYGAMSTSTQWLSEDYTDVMKLGDTMMAYDYYRTFQKAWWETLLVIEEMIPAEYVTVLDQWMEKHMEEQWGDFVVKRQTTTYVIEEWIPEWMPTEDLQEMFDRMIQQQLSYINMSSFEATPGNIQKVVVFMMYMNGSEVMEGITEMGMTVIEDMVRYYYQIYMPQSIREEMTAKINALEEWRLNEYLQKRLMELTGNNTNLQMVVSSSVVESMSDSVSASMEVYYLSVREEVGEVMWGIYSQEEKFVRVMLATNMVMTDALHAGQERVTEMYNYYMGVMFPVYSVQCGYDMANVSVAMSNIMNEDSIWAGLMMDSWGKMPSGVAQGTLAWVGNMDECIAVKGHRMNVLDSVEAYVVEPESIIGAWSLVHVNMGEINTQLGVCMPHTCTNKDIESYFGRVRMIGGDITLVKQRSEYPGVKEEYMTDSKFIGVSVFFSVLTVVIMICSVYDRYILMECKQPEHKHLTNKKRPVAMGGNLYSLDMPKSSTEDLYKGSETSQGTGAAAASTVYDGGEAVHENGGYVASEEEDAVVTANHKNTDLEATTELKEAKRRSESLGHRLVKAFSLYQSLPRLLDMSPQPNQLRALHGIRFLSMTWVIFGHVYFIAATYQSYIRNPTTAVNFGADGDWMFMGVSGALYAVDSFFLLSGLLVGYLFLRMMEKVKGKIGCLGMVYYYVHRYFRLLPLYAGVILIVVAYQRYIGFGPFNSWPELHDWKEPCETNWWTNLLYINNFVKPEAMCVGWSWYLANDMQFYVISPIFLFPLYWFPSIGVAMIAVMWVVHVGVTGWQWAIRDGGSTVSDQDLFTDIYIKPWARIGPYLVGLLLAFILHKKYKIKNMLVKSLMWILAIGLIVVCVYLPYDSTKEGGVASSSWNAGQRAAFETLSRSAWAIGLGWIVYAANNNCGGPIGDILSWCGWAPLSRLTYAAYLIHLVIMDSDAKNMHSLIDINHYELYKHNIAYVVMSYVIGALLHLLLEAPIMALEKIIFPMKRK